MSPSAIPAQAGQTLRWTGRILSLAGFLVWGAFFLEHLGWFRDPLSSPPSIMVWVMMSAHLTLLLGYLFSWWRERIGVLLILIGAGLFFPFVGGPNGWWMALVSAVPAVTFFLAWRLEARP